MDDHPKRDGFSGEQGGEPPRPKRRVTVGAGARSALTAPTSPNRLMMKSTDAAAMAHEYGVSAGTTLRGAPTEVSYTSGILAIRWRPCGGILWRSRSALPNRVVAPGASTTSQLFPRGELAIPTTST